MLEKEKEILSALYEMRPAKTTNEKHPVERFLDPYVFKLRVASFIIFAIFMSIYIIHDSYKIGSVLKCCAKISGLASISFIVIIMLYDIITMLIDISKFRRYEKCAFFSEIDHDYKLSLPLLKFDLSDLESVDKYLNIKIDRIKLRLRVRPQSFL